jgi:uncharacterized protein (TIGR02246 family)
MPISTAAVHSIAEAYTAAWNSGAPEAVASFYAATGRIVINGGAPWQGRAEVARMAQGFFADVPDLVLTCDTLRCAGDHAAYLWTFTGHHAVTKNPLSIAGLEEWDFDAEGKIASSRGWYDALDYARQVAGQ